MNRFIGSWVTHPVDQAIQWDIALAGRTLSVAGTDLGDGERFEVSRIRFDGTALHWRALMPSTNFATEQRLVVHSDGWAEHRYTIVQVAVRRPMTTDEQPKPLTAETYNSVGHSILETNPRLARLLFEQAAGMGSALGFYNLSVCYAYGYGCPRDDEEAVRLEREAARQGSVDGIVAIAFRLLRGLGIEKDVGAALRLYKRASLRGNASAHFSLGQHHYNAGDFVRARRFLLLAEGCGHARAIYLLGRIAWTEAKRSGDLSAAWYWLLRAKKLGSSEAREFLQTKSWKEAVLKGRQRMSKRPPRQPHSLE